MISLFIDTSHHNLIVAIYEELDELVYICEKNDNNLSIRLLPLINQAFESIDKKASDIDKIFCVVGPGSFTGIRIGVATVKIMAWALNKKVIPISELELLSTSKTDKKYVIPMIDARRDHVYAGMYDTKLKSIRKDKYVLKQEFLDDVLKKYAKEDIEIVSYDTIVDVKTVIPQIKVEKIIKKYYYSEGIIAHQLNPNYLKNTEAEEKKQKMKK